MLSRARRKLDSFRAGLCLRSRPRGLLVFSHRRDLLGLGAFWILGPRAHAQVCQLWPLRTQFEHVRRLTREASLADLVESPERRRRLGLEFVVSRRSLLGSSKSRFAIISSWGVNGWVVAR